MISSPSRCAAATRPAQLLAAQVERAGASIGIVEPGAARRARSPRARIWSTGSAGLSQRTEERARPASTGGLGHGGSGGDRATQRRLRAAARRPGGESASIVASRGGATAAEDIVATWATSTSAPQDRRHHRRHRRHRVRTTCRLNAAVEARAGEQGRGSAGGRQRGHAPAAGGAAAEEIRVLIGESVGRVETESRRSSKAREAPWTRLCQIREVALLMIAEDRPDRDGPAEQGIGEVSKAVNVLDHGVTQQNAALVEESAAAADSLVRAGAAPHRGRRGVRAWGPAAIIHRRRPRWLDDFGGPDAKSHPPMPPGRRFDPGDESRMTATRRSRILVQGGRRETNE